MATGTKQINGTYTASINKVNSVPVANIASINGVTWASNNDSLYNNVIDYSCMFDSDSSTYMQYTPAAAGTEEIWTYSCWVKRSILGTIQILLNAAAGEEIGFTAADKLRFTTATGDLLTTPVFRDCSGWYHIVVATDTTQAVAADRVNIYVNGSLISDYDTEDYMDQNEVTDFLKNAAHTLGANEGGTEEFDGYMAEFVLIDGTQYAASDFGETVDEVWIPKEVSGLTFGTYGTWLDFADSADLGDDNSGNTNDWTETNFAADHQVIDTPENNYCILDTNAGRSNLTALTEGGLSPQDAGTTWHTILGTFPLKSGKWYWEVAIGADKDDIATGIIAAGEYVGDYITTDAYIGEYAQSYSIIGDIAGDYKIYNNADGGVADDNLDAPAASDILTVAVDCDAGKIWFGMYNVGSGHVWGDFGATGVGDPANGTNPSYSGLDFDLYDFVPGVSVYAHSTSLTNFGQRAFTGTKPSGFDALCTSNLSDPIVNDPQDEYINVVTYTGTGAENAITGVGFQPDFVWIKNRDAADSHCIYDSVRGATYTIHPNETTAQSADAQTLKSFDADGFTLGTANEVNTNTEDYVAWCLKETNSYGFDIVTYEGTGAAQNISHDLNLVPKYIMTKNVDDGTYRFAVYHYGSLNKTDPETDFGQTDTDAWADSAVLWNDTAPTTSQFTIGTSDLTNKSGDTYIAYVFADVEGLTKVAAYEGNGNAAGPYVYCGFRPRWIILKNTDTNGYGWMAVDTERTTYNSATLHVLFPDTTTVENTATYDLDINANGFKIRGTSGFNANNNGHLVLAFAEQPFKYANAR